MPRLTHRARRPRRIALGAAAAVVIGAGAFLAVTMTGGGAAPSATTTSAPPPTSAPPSTPATTAPGAVGTYAVGATSVSAADATVPPGTPARQLPTAVWYPAASAATTSAPDRARQPYPLLVFSQGFDEAVSAYAPLLEAWASAGFVVAAPTYPDTDPSEPGLDETDIVNHPADLRAVIDAVLGASKHEGSTLSGAVDASEIGLVGQSDGGDVTLAVGDNSADHYAGVKAVAVLSGAELASFGGAYFTGVSPPLLVVQGNADTINPPFCSVQIYDGSPAPKYYLDLLGATHLEPYTTPNSYEAVVAQVTTDFFDAELTGKVDTLSAMTAAGNVAGTATLTDGSSAPTTPPGCPGAP